MAYPEFTPEELQSEEWRDVVGYEEIYSVSNLGRVRRDAPAPGTRVGRILSLKPGAGTERNYVSVGLSWRGQRQSRNVHQIVALAFLGLPPEGEEVNHKDRVGGNNRITNLEYKSHLANMQHAFPLRPQKPIQLLRFPQRAAKTRKTKLTPEQVREIRAMYATGNFTQKQIAAHFGTCHTGVSFIVRRIHWRDLP